MRGKKRWSLTKLLQTKWWLYNVFDVSLEDIILLCGVNSFPCFSNPTATTKYFVLKQSDDYKLILWNDIVFLVKDHPFCWRRKWQPTPVFLPGEFHGQRSLVSYSPWGSKELDRAEWLSRHTYFMLVQNLKARYSYAFTSQATEPA